MNNWASVKAFQLCLAAAALQGRFGRKKALSCCSVLLQIIIVLIKEVRKNCNKPGNPYFAAAFGVFVDFGVLLAVRQIY